MNKATERFYRDFCPCTEWNKQIEEEKGRDFINQSKLYNPGLCPFCGEPIQQKLFYTDVKIYSENDVDVYEFITLKELKVLLREVE